MLTLGTSPTTTPVPVTFEFIELVPSKKSYNLTQPAGLTRMTPDLKLIKSQIWHKLLFDGP